MLKILLLTFIYVLHVNAIDIQSKPIIFEQKRIALTKEYINKHYNLNVKNIQITPKIIMIHHTAVDDFNASFNRFNPELLLSDRVDISEASALNVSAHFLVKRDGSIYQLMNETTMARHVIGLNYSAIGIENVGGEDSVDNLTNAQLHANMELIMYLKHKYPTITYLSGHYEYQCFEKTAFWLEIDKGYRTKKDDPAPHFMKSLYTKFPHLKSAPCD